jgi:hypothetical protein
LSGGNEVNEQVCVFKRKNSDTIFVDVVTETYSPQDVIDHYYSDQNNKPDIADFIIIQVELSAPMGCRVTDAQWFSAMMTVTPKTVSIIDTILKTVLSHKTRHAW